jgi:glycosyltransferase involved in cell wall biosynthesis
MLPERPRLSACIITFNEEDRIADCIRSLDWCDEIVVVDSHSTDHTREIAAELGARVIERDWPGHVAQKEFATRAAAHDWILSLDADERVSEELQGELLALRDTGFRGACGWEMPRRSWYLGAWIRHGTWSPDRCLRLFDRRRGRWGGDNPHDRFELQEKPGRLRSVILHYPYRCFAEHLTTILAQEMHRRGKRAQVIDIVLHPMAGFFRGYVLKMGFLDGWRGLLLAYLHAHYTRMKYAKLLILQRLDSEPR